MDSGETFRLQAAESGRRQAHHGQYTYLRLVEERLRPFEKVETILHDDLCQQHLMKSSIMRRLNLVLFTGKKAMRNAALSDAAMKPKMFSAGLG